MEYHPDTLSNTHKYLICVEIIGLIIIGIITLMYSKAILHRKHDRTLI